MRQAVVTSTNGCRKCGISKKSGERSCCARGGAWFKNCGDARNTLFDHTWSDGIQACKGLATTVSVKSPPQVMLRHVEVIVHPLKTPPRHATQQHTNIYLPGSISNLATTDSADSIGLAKVTVCIWLFFSISNLQDCCSFDRVLMSLVYVVTIIVQQLNRTRPPD